MRRNNPKLDEAQDLMWTAFDTSSPAKRIELAQKALELSADCADAYVMLATEGKFKSRADRIQFLEEGVKAGLRAIGSNTIKESDGWLWGMIEARPYLRARQLLAWELNLNGQTEEAIAHYRGILRLNKGDNQGIRYLLAPLLVSLDRLTEAQRIIKEYPDDVGPDLNYTHALLLFKKEGDTKKSREVLGEAVRWNRHVVPFLLTPKLPRRRIPDRIVVGGPDEAHDYARRWRQSWHKTRGATDWLVEVLLESYLEHKKLYIGSFVK